MLARSLEDFMMDVWGKRLNVLGRILTVKRIEVTQLLGPARRLSCCNNLIG